MDAMELQSAMRLGSGRDIYYYTRDTLHKQSIPTIVDNRFLQALNNTAQGSSTFIISVDQGISDILFAVKLPEQGVGAVDYTNLALPRGWAYQLINRISVRYAGSSQYFWTGGQVLIENMREMPNPVTKQQLFEVGGALMDTLAAFSGDQLYGYCYLNLPHCSPNGSLDKPNPFPSELLNQPIVVTLEMNPIASIFSSGAANGSLVGAPTQLEKAWFQVKQVHAKDRGQLMASSADRSKAYSFPTKAFYQNEITINLSGQLEYQPLLTGFRNGQVRSIILWVTKDSDIAPAQNAPFAKNFTKFYLPHDIQLLYNGTVYYRADASSSEFWNLVSTETPSLMDSPVLVAPVVPGNAVNDVAWTSKWVEIPFSQVFEQLSGSHMYVSGMNIQNAVVNLQLTLPDTDPYTLHAVYAYNCVLMCQGGSAEYVF